MKIFPVKTSALTIDEASADARSSFDMARLKKIGSIITASLIFAFPFFSNVHAAPGDPDPTFDSDGKTMTAVSGNRDEARDVVVQTDGKIVVLGDSRSGSGETTNDFSLVRYNADGSLDTSFGTGGKVISPEAGNQLTSSLLILPDGKILAIGTGSENHGVVDYNVTVYRYNSDGSFDTTFGTGGKIIYNFPDGSWANDAVLQPDGKIIIAGGIDGDFTVFRLNANGTLDTSFNSVGYNTIQNSSINATGVALQTDGKIVVCGKGNSANIGFWGRFNSNGTFEDSALRGLNMTIEHVAIQSDGKIVFAGEYSGLDGKAFLITRYNSDKTLDTSFGNSGVNKTYTLAAPSSLLIEPNGKILVGGYSQVSNVRNFALARYNTDGFLDVGFGNGGKIVTPIGADSSEIYGIARQADGKIVAAGFAFTGTTSESVDFAVARYEGGGSNTLANRTPFDFDGDGRADISVLRPSTNVWYSLFSLNYSVGIQSFGASGDISVPADYDGDGRTDIGIYRPSTRQWWYFATSTNTVITVFWGVGDDIPRPSDVDGDGRADLVTFRPADGNWYRLTTTAPRSTVAFGIAEDKPLIGDFDGDGKADPAVFRPSTGDWWYTASASGGAHHVVHWGAGGDIPVPGDYDGDGKTDFVVFRPTDGGWYILYSTGSYTIATFGTVGDKPIAADYDGDGKTDIGVFRPSTGTWYLLQTTAGFGAVQWGMAGDIPSENAFLP